MSALRNYLHAMNLIPGGPAAGGSSTEDKISALGTALEYGVEGMAQGIKIGILASGAAIAAQLVSNWKGLGAPYMEMQAERRKESTSYGFSHGFVCGLMDWSPRQTKDHFWTDKHKIQRNPWDRGEMDAITVNAYNGGVASGHVYGATPASKKLYLKEIKQFANVTPPMNWDSKKARSDYAVDLAIAFRKYWAPYVSLG